MGNRIGEGANKSSVVFNSILGFTAGSSKLAALSRQQKIQCLQEAPACICQHGVQVCSCLFVLCCKKHTASDTAATPRWKQSCKPDVNIAGRQEERRRGWLTSRCKWSLCRWTSIRASRRAPEHIPFPSICAASSPACTHCTEIGSALWRFQRLLLLQITSIITFISSKKKRNLDKVCRFY